uniref:Putative sefir domain protein n=1 Tax=Rhipicephalus pulchellus TaxID=72859 RepID=L7M3G1_RHIPC
MCALSTCCTGIAVSFLRVLLVFPSHFLSHEVFSVLWDLKTDNMSIVSGCFLAKLLVIVLLLCSFRDVGSSDSSYYPAFCSESTTSLQTNCSFMLRPPGPCIIHHTNSCLTYDYSAWNLDEDQVVSSFEDLDYKIYLSTYVNTKEIALNVSFETTSKDVRGFEFSLLDHKFTGTGEKYKTCRMFDLRNYPNTSASVFYDCYKKIRGDYLNNYFFVTSRGLPTNRVGMYFVTLSTSPLKLGAENVCNWESTIMILEPALRKKIVTAQFGLAHVKFNVTRYNISLVSWDWNFTNGGVVVQEQIIEVEPGDRAMTTVSFTNVAAGKYYLRIHPEHPDWNERSCEISRTDTFEIPGDAGSSKNVMIVSMILVPVLLGAVVTTLVIYIYIKKKAAQARRSATVFLLYSYDSATHFQAVQALYQFLSRVPGLRVVFDVTEANEMGAPHQWLPTWLHRADYILLVVSQGVHEKVEKHKRPAREHHPWGDLVTPAIYDIVRLPDLQKKLVKVLMNDIPETYVPTSLFTRGVVFKLPKHISKMLHHIFGEHQCHSRLQCMARHPLWPDPNCEQTFRNKLVELKLSKDV